MTTHQLRVYSLADAASAERYATEHWRRHVATLPAFGILPLGVWVDRNDPTRVLALVAYAPEVDPAEADRAYLASAEFLADMAGFPMSAIRGVEATWLDPADSSPLR